MSFSQTILRLNVLCLNWKKNHVFKYICRIFMFLCYIYIRWCVCVFIIDTYTSNLYHLHFVMLMSLAFLSDASMKKLMITICYNSELCISHLSHKQPDSITLSFEVHNVFQLLSCTIHSLLPGFPTHLIPPPSGMYYWLTKSRSYSVYSQFPSPEGTVLLTFFQTNPWKRWLTIYIVSNHMV